MDITRKTLKENIKKYRNALKHDGIEYCKSADKFAQFVGIEISTYKKYESINADIVPPYENLIRIAMALCVSIDKLFNYESPNKMESFLKDIGILYEKDIHKTKWILSYPFKSKHIIHISNESLTRAIKSYRVLKLKSRTKFDKQFIFMNIAAETIEDPDNLKMNVVYNAENIVKQIEKLKEWRKEKDYYYGYKYFRGGKE